MMAISQLFLVIANRETVHYQYTDFVNDIFVYIF